MYISLSLAPLCAHADSGDVSVYAYLVMPYLWLTVYHGAPNGKKFGPSSKSMLFADDFETPEKMAEHILYLDKNDTAYQEYLEWKHHGPTDDFVSSFFLFLFYKIFFQYLMNIF